MSDRSLRTLPNEAYGNLTARTRVKFNLLLACMGQIERNIAGGDKVEPTCRAIAANLRSRTFKLSAHRLRKIWNAYQRHGESALVDHNLCGGKCGLPDCPGRPEAVLTDETVEAWMKLAEKNDKASLRWAHRQIIGKLMRAEPIAGAGTWRTLFAQLNPHKPQPAQCPWNHHRPPVGWSLSSFMARKPATHEYLAAKKGLAAAENALTESLAIRTDLSALRPMEVIVFDDHRLDFKAWVGREVVELWGVFAMDLATRKILAWGVRPRLESDDGTRQSITRRDMQHLVAGLLGTHGLPTDYPCTLLVENAAAAITDQVEQDLRRMTGGRVVIDRSGVGDGRSIGYAEKWGKPRGKRWLESWFNLFEIEIGAMKGQMGNRWENKRGDFDARQNLGTKLARLDLMEALPEAARPFDDLEAARLAIHDAILRTENRAEHALVNFETVREWRTSAADVWKPCTDPFFLSLPAEKQNAIMASDETGNMRKETPAERFSRMHAAHRFTALDANAQAFLWLDVAIVDKYAGADAITFTFAGRTFDFSGTTHTAQIGKKVVVRFDADRPDLGCVLESAEGRILGSMRLRRPPGYFEREKIGEQLGERQKALGKMLRNVRTRHADRQQVEALGAAVPIIAAAIPRPEKALPESRDAGEALAVYASAQGPETSSAEAVLRRAKLRDRKAQAEPKPEASIETAPSTPAAQDDDPDLGPAW